MKAYILSEDDFEQLLIAIDRDPQWGHKGGSSGKLSQTEQDAHDAAHPVLQLPDPNLVG